MESSQTKLGAKRPRDELEYRGLDSHGRPYGLLMRPACYSSVESAIGGMAGQLVEEARRGESEREC